MTLIGEPGSAGVTTGAGRAALPDSARLRERQELMVAAQQFEAMLLTQMLREMRRAGEWKGDDEGASGLGLGTESFSEAIDQELGLHLAKHRGIGLTAQLMESFERLSEARGVAPASAHGGTVSAAVDATPDSHGARAPEALTEAAVTSEFGWRKDPFSGAVRFHRGVDLRAAYGQDIPVAAPGRVVFSGEQGGYGLTVVVEHGDGSRTRYAHLSSTRVSSGAEVAAGDVLGQAGRSGRATAPHLHFEVTGPDGEAIAPSQWMQRHAEATGA